MHIVMEEEGVAMKRLFGSLFGMGRNHFNSCIRQERGSVDEGTHSRSHLRITLTTSKSLKYSIDPN